MDGESNTSLTSKKTVSRIMLEAFVRKRLTDLKADPERTIRNLLDMAQQFTNGRFVKHILTLGQNMLQNEQSGYYSWINDTATNVDIEHLIGFFMNLCYNGLTEGAKTIRKIERTDGYNIPWFSAITVTDELFEKNQNRYHKLIEEGKRLGIYTWYIFCEDEPSTLIPLLRSQSDCAFILFTTPEKLCDSFLDEAETLTNLMISAEYNDYTEKLCRQMRERKLLFSVHYVYDNAQAESIIKDDMLFLMEELHPLFAFFVPTKLHVDEDVLPLKEYLSRSKLENMRKAPGVELWTDSRAIDRVVSDDDCGIAFDESGEVCKDISKALGVTMSFMDSSLESILRTYFKKGK